MHCLVDVAQVAVRAPSICVTFDLSPRPLNWPSSPVQSVNEVEDQGGMAERLSVCERLLNVWRLSFSTHAGSGLCCCAGGVVKCCFGVVLYYWLCGLPVGFRWSVEIFGELVSLRNRMVLASRNAHFRLHPCSRCDGGYLLMNVFHVVHLVSVAPNEMGGGAQITV